jgi:hypothetical protein
MNQHIRDVRGNSASFDLRTKTHQACNKSEKERAAIFKGTAGRVKSES